MILPGHHVRPGEHGGGVPGVQRGAGGQRDAAPAHGEAGGPRARPHGGPAAGRHQQQQGVPGRDGVADSVKLHRHAVLGPRLQPPGLGQCCGRSK